MLFCSDLYVSTVVKWIYLNDGRPLRYIYTYLCSSPRGLTPRLFLNVRPARCGSAVLTALDYADCKALTLPLVGHPTRNVMENTAFDQAASLEAEATRLAELVAVVRRLAEARPCDSSALRAALLALTGSDLSDRTLHTGSCDVRETLLCVEMQMTLSADVNSAVLRVGAAFCRAVANLDTGYAARALIDNKHVLIVDLMDAHPTELSVQTDGLFALADYLSLNAEEMRVGARAGAFRTVSDALRQHGAALVSATKPALPCVLESAIKFFREQHITEDVDFAATVGAIALILALAKGLVDSPAS